MKQNILPVLGMLMFLSGCAMQPAAEELLRAPQLSPQLSVVQNALNSYLGESAQLKYPRGGNTSSPFLFSDLDGDGVDEAVVLYQSESKGLNVHLAVLEQNSANDWVVTQEVEGPSTEVESISWVDLQYENGNELVVLYSAPATGTEDFLAVYSYNDKTLTENSLWPCSGYLLEDVTGSGNDDVVMVRWQDDRLSLSVLTAVKGELHILPDLALDSRFVNCENLLYSHKNNEHFVVVDGLDKSGYTISELLTYDEQTGQMYQYIEPNGEDIVGKSARLKPGMYSTDINGDGVVEIPVVEQEITTVNSARRLSFVTWRDFTRHSNNVVQFGILDMEYGFFVRLPIALMGKITVTDGAVPNGWQICIGDGQHWIVDVTTYNKEKELPPYLKEYEQVCLIGQNRILINTNPMYFIQDEIIMQGIYLL